MITGQCNCGAVAFSVEGDTSGVIICHCSICRRATGANGIAVVIANKDQFQWTSGADQVTTWHKPVGDWATSFCQTCGSTLPGSNDETRMYIPAGLISEGGENLKVAHHIFVDSKAAWDEIGDQGKIHSGAFNAN